MGKSDSPNVGQIRAVMPDSVRERCVGQALLAAWPTLALYVGAVLLTIVVPPWLQWLPSLIAGWFSAMLFVVGHDAAHEALTPYRWLNGLIGRFALLPGWHNFTGWVHAHNHVHHGWTNYRPKDYVWAPPSPTTYNALPKWRQALTRFYRSAWGFGAYYMIEIVFKRITLVQRDVKNAQVRWTWRFDNLFLFTAITAQSWGVVVLARHWGIETHAALLVLWAVVVPSIVTSYLIGFVTYLHHTHPQVPWFDDQHEWSFYRGQILGTTHVDFGRAFNSMSHNIMEHTAHHVDPRVPLYHLIEAQRAIEKVYDALVHYRFSLRGFFYIQRVCQLYDSQTHRWMSYRGEATSSQTFDREADLTTA